METQGEDGRVTGVIHQQAKEHQGFPALTSKEGFFSRAIREGMTLMTP